MEFQEVFAQLRQRTGLSQSEVAERLFVTRQAVSRWERGETIPEVETLQALSRLFGVSINTLLGSPRTCWHGCSWDPYPRRFPLHTGSTAGRCWADTPGSRSGSP